MKTLPFLERSELGRILQTFKRELVVCAIFSATANVLMLTPTLYMLQLFDRVMISKSELTLLAMTLVMLFLFAVMAFSEWARTHLLVRVGARLDQQLNSRVFKASFDAYLRHRGRDPVQPFSDLTNVRQFLTGNGVFAFMDAPWTPIYIFVLFLLHPFLGVLGLVFSAILLTLALYSQRLTQAPLEVALDAGGRVNTYVASKLKNAEVIESMGMLGNLRRQWQLLHQRHLVLNHQVGDVGARVQAVTKFVRYTQQSLALGAGALLVINGELTPGAMIAANMLMTRATQPIDMLLGTWKSFSSVRQAYLRLEDLLESNPERGLVSMSDVPQGNLRAENLVATAPGRQSPILKGLTADFAAGQVIGIIGPSGSGKSTLARTLLGIWPYVESGVVYLDGEPIATRDREELGPYLGYLPQDIELFEGTIAENIARFGEVNPEKVILASQRAGVHDMVLRLPKGYDTPMGEAGSLLSGGQRQRIGLARAMYGNPALVVLDEPNSNLDDVGEAALVAAVLELKRQGATVLMITHRTNILAAADSLLVLKDGVIVRYGPRDEVVSAMQRQSSSPPQPISTVVRPA